MHRDNTMPQRWLSVTSEFTLASIRSKESMIEMMSDACDSMSSVCYRYFHSKNFPKSCDTQDQNLSLEFTHEGELSYPKEKVREFWQLLDKTVFLQKTESSSQKKDIKRKGTKMRKRKKPEPPSILATPNSATEGSSSSSSSSGQRSSTQTGSAEEPPALPVLKMLMDRGVDLAALAIRANYPLQPHVCTCGQECCLCAMFSSHWDGELARYQRERQRLFAQHKLRPGEDPFPLNLRNMKKKMNSK